MSDSKSLPVGQPSLGELMARFLASRNSLPADDRGEGEVEPHEVRGGFRIGTAVTWDEARLVFRILSVDPDRSPSPPEWGTFTATCGSLPAVPLAAGLFPQRVREVPRTLTELPNSRIEPVPAFSALRGWIQNSLSSRIPSTLLIVSGVAAGLGETAIADAALAAAEPLCTGRWRPVWENQRGAVLWLRGQHREAAGVWANTAPAYNRGLATLAAGRAREAALLFTEAATQLPDSSGWSHLAKMYLALAGGQD